MQQIFWCSKHFLNSPNFSFWASKLLWNVLTYRGVYSMAEWPTERMHEVCPRASGQDREYACLQTFLTKTKFTPNHNISTRFECNVYVTECEYTTCTLMVQMMFRSILDSCTNLVLKTQCNPRCSPEHFRIRTGQLSPLLNFPLMRFHLGTE